MEILPAGPVPPNPPVLLESETMAQLVEQLLSRADLVIIDAPPLGHFSDAQILGAKASGVLMVVEPNRARRGVVRGAKRLLDMAGARVVGVLCNKAHRTGMAGYYYYGSRYYYYYDRYYGKYYGEDDSADDERRAESEV